MGARIYADTDITRLPVDQIREGDLLAARRGRGHDGYTAHRINRCAYAGRDGSGLSVWEVDASNGVTYRQPLCIPMGIVRRELTR